MNCGTQTDFNPGRCRMSDSQSEGISNQTRISATVSKSTTENSYCKTTNWRRNPNGFQCAQYENAAISIPGSFERLECVHRRCSDNRFKWHTLLEIEVKNAWQFRLGLKTGIWTATESKHLKISDQTCTRAKPLLCSGFLVQEERKKKPSCFVQFRRGGDSQSEVHFWPSESVAKQT
jgi:hypothetical protein